MIIAVDGPSAAGKSTIARAVADELGFPYLDTGSMYRAVTLAVLERGVDPGDAKACARVASDIALAILGPGQIAVDGRDVSVDIRGPEVTAMVSAVSAHPNVRNEMVALQRAFAQSRSAVVEGRDIGTVVFPDAELKVFLTADPGERSRRREAQFGAGSGADIERRDKLDSSRVVSPLEPAPDAVVIDTTGRDPAAVAHEVVELASSRMPR